MNTLKYLSIIFSLYHKTDIFSLLSAETALCTAPYCKKNKRFSQSYITKISNQIDWVARLLQNREYEFRISDFSVSLIEAKEGDFIYCDPPYIDRHSDYFNTWDFAKEKTLCEILKHTKAKFILSTWHSNQYRQNEYIETLWGDFYNDIIKHFYHLGASEKNRCSIKELLVKNYMTCGKLHSIPHNGVQHSLF